MPITLGALAAAAAVAFAGVYDRFEPVTHDYELQFPTEWMHSARARSVRLVPPGPDGKDVEVDLVRYPVETGDPATPRNYRDTHWQRPDIRDVRASREDAPFPPGTLRASYVTSKRQRVVDLLIPVGKRRYYVFSLKGRGDAFFRAQGEFEMMAKNIVFAEDVVAPKKPAKKKHKKKAEPKPEENPPEEPQPDAPAQ